MNKRKASPVRVSLGSTPAPVAITVTGGTLWQRLRIAVIFWYALYARAWSTGRFFPTIQDATALDRDLAPRLAGTGVERTAVGVDEPKIVRLNAYQTQAARFASYPFDARSTAAIWYCVTGLCGEAGEVADKWKKILRDKGSQISIEDRKALLHEMGDVLWYISQLASELSIELSDVAGMNLAKLQDRLDRNKLHGEGDNR